MKIAIEINGLKNLYLNFIYNHVVYQVFFLLLFHSGVETKYTFLSSVAMAAFCLIMSVGSIVVLVFSNGSCILEFLLHL